VSTFECLVAVDHEREHRIRWPGRPDVDPQQLRNPWVGQAKHDAMSDDVAMARVELLDVANAPISAEAYFDGGDPGPIVAALASVPELLGPTLGFVGAALGDGAAASRHKEFAILRTSVLQGCRYCVTAHTAVSLDAGLDVAEIRALRGDVSIESAFHDERERALIGWIDAMAGATGPVPDDVWTSAREHWPAHVLVELSVTIGATMFLNRFATGFELPTSPDVETRLASAGLT
jgi:AhpD family alkylhydroperoxidase